MRFYYRFICCLLISCGCYYWTIAQNNLSDSLISALNKTLPDTDRIDILNKIGWELRSSVPDSAYQYLEKAVSLADSIKDMRRLATAYRYLGIVSKNLSKLDEALENYEKAESLFKQLADRKGQAEVLNNIGYVYHVKGDNTRAIEKLIACRTLAEELGLESTLISSLSTLGIIYIDQKNFVQAYQVLSQAQLNCEKRNDLNQLRFIYLNLGVLYFHKHKSDSALYYYEKSADACRKVNDLLNLSNALTNIGSLLTDMRKYEKALKYLSEALEVKKALGNEYEQIITLGAIAMAYQESQQPSKAEFYMNQAVELATKVNTYRSLMLGNQIQYQIYASQRKFEQAYLSMSDYMRFHDSLTSETNNRRIAELQARYETAEKERKIALYQKNEELAKEQIRRQYFYIIGVIVALALVFVIALVLLRSNRIKQSANRRLAEANDQIQRTLIEVQHQKEIIEEKNNEIQDSIHYARRIQNAILPTDADIKRLLAQVHISSGLFYRPRDIVSGDFYWIGQYRDYLLAAVIDCTGHGVPGAFMSVVGYNLLNQVVIEHGLYLPGSILSELDIRVRQALHQDQADGTKDGMDVGLLQFSKTRDTVLFAGAGRPLYHQSGTTITEIKGDKFPVGGSQHGRKQFTTQEISLTASDRLILFSDGITDQFGGTAKRKFTPKRLKEFILAHQHTPIEMVGKALATEMDQWMENGKNPQLDDLTFWAFEYQV